MSVTQWILMNYMEVLSSDGLQMYRQPIDEANALEPYTVARKTGPFPCLPNPARFSANLPNAG